MQKLKKQKGITLIALIITIIVMLILVGVSVTVTLKGGLFKTAQDAANNTRAERDNEIAISNGDIIDQYLSGTGNGSGTGTDTEYAIGTEVTIGETGENFYVIKDNGAELVLLAKYNLNTAGTAQDTEGNSNPCPFSTTPYWTGEDADLSDNDNPDGAMAIAKAYGLTVSGTEGRLMTLEEVEALGGSRSDYSTSACNTNGNKFVNSPVEGVTLNYWLGSARGTDYVWNVYGSGSGLDGNDFSLDSHCGVRPVVVISESSVEIVP